MKISLNQFLCLRHSWGNVGTSLARSFKSFGHDPHLCSTNGYDPFPEDLIENIKCKECIDDHNRIFEKCNLDKSYDLSLSYTIPLNWSHYLRRGSKRFAIYNYDGSVLPTGWAKHHSNVDLVLPSSQYAAQTLINAKIPKDKIIVIPHGYNDEFINRTEKYPLKTNKKYKVLINIQQPHLRKNLKGLLEAWCLAFDKKDDICLVAKVRRNKAETKAELSFKDELTRINKKYPNHAEIITIEEFIPFISDLYRAVDIVFSMSHIECFLLPAIEALISEKINICSAYGGQIDYCNENNSLLINGKMERAPVEMLYWQTASVGDCFVPNIDDAVDKLRLAYTQHDQLKEKFTPQYKSIKDNYSWNQIANKILGLI